MSAGAARATAVPAPGRPRLGRDSLAMMIRNLLILRRIPQQIVFATVQPIMIVLRVIPAVAWIAGLLAVFALLAAVTVRRSDA